MGKKGGLTAIFFSKLVDVAEDGSLWPSWPPCRNPQTASFREDDDADGAAAARLQKGAGEMFKTVNSVYQMEYCSADGSCCFDEEEEEVVVVDDDDGGSFSTTTASEEWSEAVIRSLGRTSTDRFFVDSGPASNSILALSPGKKPSALPEIKAAAASEEMPECEPSSSLVEESVAVAMDSEDPYGDFRASMEEMVAAHGLRGWEAMEELLLWYLRINGKHNHALIVGAFVDLLVGLATPPSSVAQTTTTTTTTSSRGSASTASTTSTSSSTCGGPSTPATGTTEHCGTEIDADEEVSGDDRPRSID